MVRVDVNEEKKIFYFFFWGGGGVGSGRGVGLGGQDRINRSEVFVKIQKKNIVWGGRFGGGVQIWGGGGVRVYVTEELKFL